MLISYVWLTTLLIQTFVQPVLTLAFAYYEDRKGPTGMPESERDLHKDTLNTVRAQQKDVVKMLGMLVSTLVFSPVAPLLGVLAPFTVCDRAPRHVNRCLAGVVSDVCVASYHK